MVSPDKVIRENIHNPALTIQILQQYPAATLRNYRDQQYNNLMHITVAELLKKKNSRTYEKSINESKLLLAFMAGIGISVNEMNDDSNTPLFLAYQNDFHGNSSNQHAYLSNFLEYNLDGHPTHFSLEPQIRAIKKALLDSCCGCFKSKSKQS
jgi:hypothetical protein